MAAIAPIGLALALLSASASPTISGVRKATTIPPETVTTSTYYDTASHRLTITCDSASRGLCRFTVVDGDRSKIFALRPKTRSVIAGVSDKARVCAVGKNPGLACNLVPVAT